MHPIRAVALAASAVLALSIPSLSLAHGNPHAKEHGFAYGTEDEFTWAIIDGGSTSMSGQLDHDRIETLKDRFGDRFLYIEDDDDGYVITERALVERARRASRRIGRYGREIGEIASTQAKLSLSEARSRMRGERGFELSSEEKRDLTKRRDLAKTRLHEAVEQINEEMRDILREAKSRRIAERVD
jgi:hypothetical protein